jgi:hypothetical protein
MSLVNTAVTAVVAKLSEAPALAPVGRVRLRPVAASAPNQVVVRPADAQVAEFDHFGRPVSWSVRLGVECYSRALAGQAPDQAVDALLSSVHDRLMADPTLGGQVVLLQPQSLTYDFDAEDQALVAATFVFTCLQRAGATF